VHLAAFTDHQHTPSSRFRVRQFIPHLLTHGITVHDMPRKYSSELAGRFIPRGRIRTNPVKLIFAIGFEALNVGNTLSRVIESHHYNGSWVSRELLVGYPSFEGMLKKNLFYDIDDAVFLHGGVRNRGIIELIRNAKFVFAGNSYLADYCSQFSKNVLIIPTAVDVNRFTPRLRFTDRKSFVVGWSGTSTSFKYLLTIKDELRIFLTAHREAIFKVCADRFPSELEDLSKYISYEKWSSDLESDQIQQFDVGIMPLENSEWVKGKCAYKMLLYASCGIPTISSNFGMNKELLATGKLGIGCDSVGQWSEALNFMFQNRDRLAEMYPDCRDIIAEGYSLDVVSSRLATAFKYACRG